MKLLIRQVEIVDPTSAFNGKIVDVFIVNGSYHTIANTISLDKIPSDTQIIEEKNCCLSVGWLDMRSNFRQPGEEQKETIASGQAAAAQGGFTAVLLMPSTKPEIQTRSDVEFVMRKSESNAVTVFQAGALTKNHARIITPLSVTECLSSQKAIAPPNCISYNSLSSLPA